MKLARIHSQIGTLKGKGIMKWSFAVVLAFLFVFSESGRAQSSGDQPIVQQGSLVSLKIIPKKHTVEFYLAGVKGAEVAFEQAGLTGTVLIGQKQRALNFAKEKGFFSVNRSSLPAGEKSSMKLDVKVEGKSESFRVDLPPQVQKPIAE